VLILRKDPVEHRHFHTWVPAAVIAAVCCLYLVLPFSGRDPEQYKIAAVLLVLGVVLWALTLVLNRITGTHADRDLADIES
jgi:drug/metabolite transporter (DMT)-like permease